MVEEAGPHTPLFSLEGRTLHVKVIDAYDADTVTVALTLGDELCAFKVRLTGIDTPEMRPPRARPNREQEKRMAVRARNTLIGWVTSGDDPEPDVRYSRRRLRREFFEPNRKLVWLRAGPFDKYGRLLGELFEQSGGGGAFNQRLLDAGLARPYDGRGTRQAW